MWGIRLSNCMRVGCWRTLSMPAIGRTLAFVVANTVAGLVALYIGCANNLERPYWAVCTLFIVAKPITGAVRSRAAFRLLGTVVGAAMALRLVPPLVQAPTLLCLATSVWIGLCLYLSLHTDWDAGRPIDRGIAALGAQRPTQAVEDGESALVGLRLDLTSFRGHQLSPPRTP